MPGEQTSESLSIFFPCYNEEKNVEAMIDKAVEVCQKLDRDYEIIAVNDGSSDRTKELAEKKAAENDHVRVINHPTNLGYGAALQSGFTGATKDLVFYTDGDGQFDLNELPPLLPLAADYDIVTCYRLNRQDNFIRKLNGWAWTKLVCLLFRFRITDVDCAFKLFKRQIFDNIKMTTSGAMIDAEILARSTRKGYTYIQKPVHHYPRTAGAQTGANIKVILRAFKELFKLYLQIRSEKD
jgi:glycosyltransferase involved in cell wall biosynthesis